MEPGFGAVVFLTFCIIIVFSAGAFLVWRVMTKPGAHIGSRLPKHDPNDAEDPSAEATPSDPSHPGSDDGPDGPDDPNRR
jgi:hypothetical protein